jgi:hypothetical protein
VSIDGRAVPFVYDSTAYDGGHALYIIYGRSLQFFPGDTARYTHSTSIRYRKADGSIDPVYGSAQCVYTLRSYGVSGNRVLLGEVPVGNEPLVATDTLIRNGSTLVQRGYTGGQPEPSSFVYRREAPRDVCAGMFMPIVP